MLICTGDEDVSTKSLRCSALIRAIRAEVDVIVDLSGLRFADGSLMADLAMVSRRLRQRGRVLLLIGAPAQVRAMIEKTGLHLLPGIRMDGPMPALA